MSDNACWKTLLEAGLFPRGTAPAAEFASLSAGQNLLPLLVRSWETRVQPDDGANGQGDASRLDRLRHSVASGAGLTLGWPGRHAARMAADIGQRLVWWPNGIPAGAAIGILSSRLGRDWDALRPWFAALRTVCLREDTRRGLLVTGRGTAAHPFIQRAGTLFGLQILEIDIASADRRSSRQWGRRIWASMLEPRQVDGWTAVVSPPCTPHGGPVPRAELQSWPLADAAVLAAADRVIALRIRGQGNLQRMLRWRLEAQDSARPPLLAVGRGLCEPAVASDLLGRGAVGWYLLPSPIDPPPQPGATRPSESSALAVDPSERQRTDWLRKVSSPAAAVRTARIRAVTPRPATEYLIHCTRRRSGPWPDETEQDHLDRSILDLDATDHSAFSTLCRIVSSRRLLAGCGTVRGDVPVISWTEVPLDQIHHLHTFRSHLSRWDFEPYGLAILREWLIPRGARPAIYGDQRQWERLAADQQPFFQKAFSRSSGGGLTDWTVEREWRYVGDLDLEQVPGDAAFLFVPEQRQALRLATFSRWPVVVRAVPSGR